MATLQVITRATVLWAVVGDGRSDATPAACKGKVPRGRRIPWTGYAGRIVRV